MPLLKRRINKCIHILKPTIIVGVFFCTLVLLIHLLSPVYQFVKVNNISPRLIMSLFNNPAAHFKSFQNRTNILVLGMAGGDHDGADLTDSIILLSVDFENKNIALISIPRDIWLPSLKDKINTAYHYGEKKKAGGGLALAKAAVEEVTGLPVYYGWVIDFFGFKRIIDEVGGIDVEATEGFIDNYYPIEGKENDFCGGDTTFACRYETIEFFTGLQHMDGEKALKYTRSRYAESLQGTDFSRSKRQQAVLLAFKQKVIKSSYWRNPSKLKVLIEAFENMTVTDMNWSEKILLFRFFLQLKDQNIVHVTLDTGTENDTNGFLIHPPVWQYKGLWVLAPKSGNFTQIHDYIKCQLFNPQCTMQP